MGAIEALDSARVGSFGNSDRSSPAEWVPVIVVDAPDSVTADSSGSGSRFVPTEFSPRIPKVVYPLVKFCTLNHVLKF